MLLPRILAPARAVLQPCSGSIIPLTRAFDALRLANASSPAPTLSFVRHASHQTQGRANGAKDGPGKRLGAKKSGGEYVIPGNIIFRQRGTAWYPGENCKMGRDHCIYAVESGYVRYYRDPLKHPKRQYIGVVLEKTDSLPYPPNAARRRRLNMLAVRTEPEAESDAQIVVADLTAEDATSVMDTPRTGRNVVLGKTGYAFRQSNWEIGRAAENNNVKVKPFIPGDRWRAWQRSAARIKLNAERKRLRTAQKASKPKAKRR